MRTFLLGSIGILMVFCNARGQKTVSPNPAKRYKQPDGIGIHFLFNDFQTAADIRATSLTSVLNNKRFGKLQDMDQGLALSYSKGLTNSFDLTSMLAGSFLSYNFMGPMANPRQAVLLEADVALRGKMLPDKYWLVPFVQLGAGVSKYRGYWGTYIPAGVGIQINFLNEAFLVINSQYRIPITETSGYHFVHSIGLVGNLSSWTAE